MIEMTRGELYLIRDVLLSLLEEDEVDRDDVRDAYELVDNLLNPEEEYIEDSTLGY